MTTCLVYHDIFLEHDTGDHPECAGRLQAIVSHLHHRKLLDELRLLDPRCVSIEDLLLVHDERYVFEVERMCTEGGGYLEPETVVSPRSFEVARYAVGGVLAAVDAVMVGDAANALCLVRPPGHHARRDQAMGFCIFNNVAVAARYLQVKHEQPNILIVDWDIHHGNGTQESFYRDASVFYFSVHRWHFYPGSGSVEEVGRDAGRGMTLNKPVLLPEGRNAFLSAFQEGLKETLSRFKPDFILISAGFDGYEADPLAGMGLQMGDFKRMTDLVVAEADKRCRGRLVSVLEGGYDLRDLGACVEQHVLGLLRR